MNVTKTKLEGLFADELALLQPSPSYMQLLKESVLQVLEGAEGGRARGIGDAERAAYRRFLELWKNLDPGLPELVEARRALGSE